MQYAVKDLDGQLLNAAVAKAMDDPRVSVVVALNGYTYASISDGLGGGQGSTERPFLPSTDWRDGGPIIEREQITIESHDDSQWTAWIARRGVLVKAPTPLIAAMRAYVASKFGDVVELP